MVAFASRCVAIALSLVLGVGLIVSPAIAQEILDIPKPKLVQNLVQKLKIDSQKTAQANPTGLTEGTTKTVLGNGLTVLLKEVHTAPVASVQVWYRVGSRNEKPGITGISHQLEHLLFKGTKDRPIQFGRLFSALGSSSNAFTSYDMTAYYGTVSSEKLEALLALEADRMVNTVAGATELKSENKVVLSELDGGNNNPSTRLYRAVMMRAFPNRSYGAPVIGYRKEVEKYTAQQVQDYYKTYYRPDNATLVVVGNFETAATLKKIEAIYGKITAPALPKSQIFPPINNLIHNISSGTGTVADPIILREPGSVSFLQSVYPTLPPVGHPDIAAIDVMDAVLTTGKSSRLYQSLEQTGLISSFNGNASTMIDPGWYIFSMTAAQGKSLPEIDAALLLEITKLQTQGITAAELTRAQTQLQASYILGNRDISSQAQQLGYNQTVALDYRYSDRYLAAVRQVTTADVQRVAQQYLNPDNRVLGFFEPTVITASAGTADKSENFSPGKPVDPAEVAKYLPKSAFGKPDSVRSPNKPEKFKLPNGLTILLQSDRSSPTVTLVGQIKAGTGFDRPEKSGLASLTAQNLLNGTRTKNALAIASNLEDRGTGLRFSASRESVSLASSMLSADLPVVVEQLADVLQNATFPESELELSLKRNLIGLKSELDNPSSLARREFQGKLFPQGHPFHAMRTETTLKSISREDIVDFHKTHYRPDTTTLTLLGDFDPEFVKILLTKELGKWQAVGKAKLLTYPQVANPKSIETSKLILNGKTQAVTLIGHPGIARRDRQYYAALVLNQVLGGDTLSSRLGTEIRDRQGLTYGIYSYFQAGVSPGPFVIQMQTNPKDTQRAIDAALAIFRQVQSQGITRSELTAAKANLINSFPVDIADPDSIATSLLNDEILGFPVGEFYQFPRKIQEITLEQVNAAARDLLYPNNLLVITATPE